jgi:nitronate monooxygenase
MPLPAIFQGRLRIPAVGAPMFIVSTPELVLAQCKAGIAGAFPALNARPIEALDEWLSRIERELQMHDRQHPTQRAAPFGVNLIVHKTNERLESDTEVVVRHKVPYVITSVGAPLGIVERVHAYGGIVFHDVTNVRHAHKAIAAGVDGLILVCAGAGGHAGALSPFALVTEVREFFAGPIILSGAISSGRAIRAAQVLGADLAYLGTRFIPTLEANATDAYKHMILASTAADIVYTPRFSGIPASYLRASIAAAGFNPDEPGTPPKAIDVVGAESAGGSSAKVWRDIWSAGQGVGTIHRLASVGELVQELVQEYEASATLSIG